MGEDSKKVLRINTITPMKIAIVHEFLTKMGGAEKVLLELHKIFPEAPIHTILYDKEGMNNNFKDCQIITSSLQKYPLFLRKKTKLFLGKLPQAIEEFNFSEYDVVISNSNSFAHGIITTPTTFHLCYCQSPMRYVWDWYHEYLCEHKIGFGLKGLYIRSLLHKIRIWDKVASQRVDYWVANSKNVQNRIKKYYKLPSDVIYPSVDIEEIKMTENIPDDYYVIVSRLEPYKRVDLAIEAFNKSEKSLVVIGTGSDKDRLKSKAKKNIEFLGWQSNESIYEYLRNAKALIFPGEDDFGLTPVEAMACGRPVIAYNKGGATETVVSGKTGLFFDQIDPDELNKAIEKLEGEYTNFTPKNCREQAEKFSAKAFAKQIEETVSEKYEEFIKKINI